MRDNVSRLQIVVWVLAALPVLIVLAVYGRLPEMIPTSWGLHNQVEYGNKSTIWMIAGMAPLFGIMFYVLPKIDPKKRNYEKFQAPYLLFQMVMQLFLIVMTGIIVTESFRPGTVDVTTVVSALCAILFIVMGNMMPKFRQNFYCGIKTPWTLSNEVVWTKTHRLGGRMMFGAGIIALAGAFLPNDTWKMMALFIPIMAAATVPAIMSYIWFQKGSGEK